MSAMAEVDRSPHFRILRVGHRWGVTAPSRLWMPKASVWAYAEMSGSLSLRLTERIL